MFRLQMEGQYPFIDGRIDNLKKMSMMERLKISKRASQADVASDKNV